IDPHGDPIPTVHGDMPSQEHLISLTTWPVGQIGVVVRLLDQSPEKLQYLEQKGLQPGASITVIEREPFDGLTHVMINDLRQVLSQSITQTVLISDTAE